MADVKNPPKGGFQHGGWYWNPSINQAQRYWNGSFLPAGQTEPTASQAVATPEQQATMSIEDSYKKLAEERNKRFKDFEKARGPFDLDEVLVAKRAEASEQIDPYYDEMLSDYLLGVRRKTERSQADTQDLLGELEATTESFTGSTQLKLTEAIGKAQEGYAESGLFDSGGRFRDEGLMKRETGDTLADFERKQGLRGDIARTGLQRTLEDVGLESKIQQRGLERERFTETESLAGRLAKESGQRYVTDFAQTLPPELQTDTGFDLLKQIGIYS